MVRVPSGMASVIRKPRTATLTWCRHGSLAFITHFGAWKVLDMGSIAENQVCRSKLAVTMDEHLGLQYFI